ncbi:unannotated protein [freshwater metagenome]|uniref:Unannotated protein n=1 Tax=freshwater metagenome TaxID=449393 RepID=A0A6J7HBZ1_9ZZZZ
MGLDGTGATTLTPPGVTFNDYMYDLTYDAATRRLYWPNGSTIAWAAADGSAGGELYPHASLPVGADAPKQIAIDPLHNRVYWASGFKIGYAALDGSGGIGSFEITGGCTFNGGNGEGMAVDGARGVLYVIGSFLGDRPVAADLDGTDCRDLLPAGVPDSLGLAVDPDGGRLYWGEYATSKVGWVSLTDPTSTGYLDTGTAKVTNVAYPTILKRPKSNGTRLSLAAGVLECLPIWANDEPGVKLFRAPATVTYTWTRNGTRVAKATGVSLTPRSGGRYSCTATATNVAGSTAATTAKTVGATALQVTTPAGAALRVRGGRLTLVGRLGGAGTVRAVVTAGGRTIASGTAAPRRAGKVTVSLGVTTAGRALLRRAGSKGLRVQATFSGAQTSGYTVRKSFTLRLRR